MTDDESNMLAEEQAALRRLATLVARGAPPDEVFAAAVEEVGRVLAVDLVSMARYEPDRAMTFLTSWGTPGHFVPIGTRLTLGGNNLNTIVFDTGRSARIDDYAAASGPVGHAVREGGVRAAAGAPIVVEGRVWGVIAAGTSGTGRLPPDTEARLASFTELLAMAIGNAESRARLARLAEEQAALRRAAMLVARGAPPEELFAAVVEEVARVFPGENAGLARYEPDDAMTVLAVSAAVAEGFPVGSRWPLGGRNVSTVVRATGRSTRIDGYGDSSGRFDAAIRRHGFVSAAGAPIVVEGRVWGVMTLSSTGHALPADAEARLVSFTELVATAIANAEARTEVAASRVRIVAAADAERRRLVRDLHDGAQQRLVHAVVTLKLARQAVLDGEAGAAALVTEALDNAEQANVELRELAHGILPVALTDGGLRPGVDALASRMALPVAIDVSVDRLPAAVEATAYFVVAEALTNVAKHARAGHAEVTARLADGTVEVRVRDDGVGGALSTGSGLVGLADRLTALGGELRVDSPAGGGTLVAAAIPLPGSQ
ncbi:MAG TPA: GAF domain-containing protein [Baekduia sp.]